MKLIGKFNLRSIFQFQGYGEMVDTQVLGSCSKKYCKGSSPFIPKLQYLKNPNWCSAARSSATNIYSQNLNVSYTEIILEEEKK